MFSVTTCSLVGKNLQDELGTESVMLSIRSSRLNKLGPKLHVFRDLCSR